MYVYLLPSGLQARLGLISAGGTRGALSLRGQWAGASKARLRGNGAGVDAAIRAAYCGCFAGNDLLKERKKGNISIQ